MARSVDSGALALHKYGRKKGCFQAALCLFYATLHDDAKAAALLFDENASSPDHLRFK